jgi:hypothetical protein
MHLCFCLFPYPESPEKTFYEDGEVTAEGDFLTTEGGLPKRFADMEPVRIAMEARIHFHLNLWETERVRG